MAFSIEHLMGHTLSLTITVVRVTLYNGPWGFLCRQPLHGKCTPWKIMVYTMTSWHFPWCVGWSWCFPCTRPWNILSVIHDTCHGETMEALLGVFIEQPMKPRIAIRVSYEYTMAYPRGGFVSRNVLWHMWHGPYLGNYHDGFLMERAMGDYGIYQGSICSVG